MPSPSIEDLVRRSLEHRADDVRPDPATWTRVQARVRRQRTVRLAAAVVTAAAAALVALVVLPAALDRPEVEFITPSEPEPEPAPAPAASCDEPAGIAAVYSEDGDIWAMCVAGGVERLYESDTTDLNPAVSPDGRRLIFERWHDESPTLFLLELDTLVTQELVLGELPAFAPDGRIAWVEQVDLTSPRIVGGRTFSERQFEIPVDGRVRRLVWDTVDDYLLYETVDREGASRVRAVHVETGRHELLEPHDHAYFSPAVGPDGTIAVLSTGASRDVLELGHLDRSMLEGAGPSFTHVAPLIPQVHPEMEGLYLAPAGHVWVDELDTYRWRWRPAEQLAWIVGGIEPGDRPPARNVYLVNEGGEMVHLQPGAETPVVNPAAQLGAGDQPEPLSLEPQALPHDVGVTRQRIYEAASAREFGALRELMAEDFTHSFGGAADRDEAIGYLQENPELLDVIAGLLELPYGVVTPEDPELFVWPWVFADGPEALWPEFRDHLAGVVGEQQVAELEEHGEWLGHRIGIDRHGIWRYFVAGD